MFASKLLKEESIPYSFVDRRSGDDRRKADAPDFFTRGGIERRSGFEARKGMSQKRGKV
jgi:hypothetical protein